jgi:hypothetical protein
MHDRFLTYEQVRKELVYAIDFAKRKAEQSTVSPVSAGAISALEQRDNKLLRSAKDTSVGGQSSAPSFPSAKLALKNAKKTDNKKAVKAEKAEKKKQKTEREDEKKEWKAEKKEKAVAALKHEQTKAKKTEKEAEKEAEKERANKANKGPWSPEEHGRYTAALLLFPAPGALQFPPTSLPGHPRWKEEVVDLVRTRTTVQVRTHHAKMVRCGPSGPLFQKGGAKKRKATEVAM